MSERDFGALALDDLIEPVEALRRFALSQPPGSKETGQLFAAIAHDIRVCRNALVLIARAQLIQLHDAAFADVIDGADTCGVIADYDAELAARASRPSGHRTNVDVHVNGPAFRRTEPRYDR